MTVTCVDVSFNPSVPVVSLLGDFTSDSHAGGHAGICHQQCVQNRGLGKTQTATGAVQSDGFGHFSYLLPE